MIYQAGNIGEELSAIFGSFVTPEAIETGKENIRNKIRMAAASYQWAERISDITGSYYVGQIVQLADGPGTPRAWVILNNFEGQLGYYLAAPVVDSRVETAQFARAQMIYNPAPVRFFKRLFDDPENTVTDLFDKIIPSFDGVSDQLYDALKSQLGDEVKNAKDEKELMDIVQNLLPALKGPVATIAATVVRELVDFAKTNDVDPMVIAQQFLVIAKSQAAKQALKVKGV